MCGFCCTGQKGDALTSVAGKHHQNRLERIVSYRNPKAMRAEQFGPATIFRWSQQTEQRMRFEAREHLLSKFEVGEYRDAKTINSIIQYVFGYYAEKLRKAVADMADRGSFEFILTNYDEACKILHGRGIVNPERRIRWQEIEGNYRRSLKYLAELITLEEPSPGRRIPREISLRAMGEALLASEMVADLAEMSNRVYGLSSNAFTLRIYPHGGSIDWEVHAVGRYDGYDIHLFSRIARDRQQRSKFLGDTQFDHHTDSHTPFLNQAFERAFGCRYERFIWALCQIIDGSLPAANAFETLFLNRAIVIKKMIELGLSPNVSEQILNGFTVCPENMRGENRVLWNPKQEHRAFRRGFFAFPHEAGQHLAFSREMARECLINLVHGVCYKRLPLEWHHPEVYSSLEALSRRAGRWFEEEVARNFRDLGIIGSARKRRLSDRLKIPDDVGEIDFLGFEARESLLVLAEAKMVNSGVEAKYWRDDIETFVTGRKSYAVKFRKKLSWVRSNLPAICSALGLPSRVSVVPVMITLYPCIASLYIEDFPCVSLTEFMLDYRKRRGWPYG